MASRSVPGEPSSASVVLSSETLSASEKNMPPIDYTSLNTTAKHPVQNIFPITHNSIQCHSIVYEENVKRSDQQEKICFLLISLMWRICQHRKSDYVILSLAVSRLSRAEDLIVQNFRRCGRRERQR